MSIKRKTLAVFCIAAAVTAGFAVNPALAQKAGPIHDEPPGVGHSSPGKPAEDVFDYTEFDWFPGDPSWLECERVGAGEFDYSLRIGTGSALEPDYGLTRDAYGNTISIESIWLPAHDFPAFDWYSDPDPIGIVIVKSGAAAAVYPYLDEPTWEDHGLLGIWPWEPSHLTFCWSPSSQPPEPPVCDWYEETGWSEGFPYNVDEQGNWGTYTPYPVIIDGVEYDGAVIWAGQHLDAGLALFTEENGNVRVTIVLHETWRFAQVAENLKIAVYDLPPPDGNPVPGSFEYKYTVDASPFTTPELPVGNFYGIHLDLEWADCD